MKKKIEFLLYNLESFVLNFGYAKKKKKKICAEMFYAKQDFSAEKKTKIKV